MGLFGKSEPQKLNVATGPRSASAQNETPSVAPHTFIGAKMIISGELNSSKLIQIEGRMEGKIKSSVMVVIGEAGRVKAKIEAANVSIRGKLEGDCTASDKIEITRTGKVFGNLCAPRIAVAEGAIFKGASQMTVNEERSAPAEPEAAEPEVAEPEVAEPEAAEPGAAEPEAAEPEAAESESLSQRPLSQKLTMAIRNPRRTAKSKGRQ